MTAITKTWTEKQVEMSHGKTRYWEAGSGYPTILIHGAGWNSGCENWALNIGPLSENLRVLALDCLNWGTGDIFDQEFSFAYLVDHVREFMDVLGIEKANFIGHSMGGWIVTLLSYESPDRIKKVVNVAGGGTATRPLQNMVDFKVPSQDQIRQAFSQRFPGWQRGHRRNGRPLYREDTTRRTRGRVCQSHETHDEPDDPAALQHVATSTVHQGPDIGHLGPQ